MKTALTCILSFIVCNVSFAGSSSLTNSRSDFENALGSNIVVEDFTNTHHFPITTGVLNSSTNLPSIGITPGTIKAGVTYSTPIGAGNFFNIDAGGGFTGGFLDTVTGNQFLTVNFDNAVQGFGFDTNQLSPNLQVVINYTDHTSQTFTNTVNSMQFFGFLSNARNISSAVIGSSLNSTFTFAIDNFTFAPAVPEPETYSLFLIGLMAAFVASRKRA
jgi:hypothetical protein